MRTIFSLRAMAGAAAAVIAAASCPTSIAAAPSDSDHILLRPDVSGDELLQVGHYKREEPTEARSIEPTITSVQWRNGHLEVLVHQTAPCGWTPINPQWNVDGLKVRLRFDWYAIKPPTDRGLTLCKKYVRAWVFSVPDGGYQVTIAGDVPRFEQRNGKVVMLQGTK